MEASLDIKFIIWNIIAFLLMVFVVKYVVWPKLNGFIEARRKEIDELLKTYNSRNEEIAKQVEAMKKESEEAAQRRIKFLEDAKSESKKVREEIIEKAYNEAKSMVEKAKQEIQQEQKLMYEELRSNISNIVIKATEQVLTNVIDADLDKKIIIETEKAVNITHEK